MAANFKVGNYATRTSTGNNAITGVGFTPKLTVLWGDYLDTSGRNNAQCLSIGAATSSSDQRVSYGSGATNANTARGIDNTRIHRLYGTDASTILNSGTFVSNDADGFTVNETVVDGSHNRNVNYMCFGGSDVTNTKTGQFALNTSTGNQSVTGLGFQPDFLMFWVVMATTTAPATEGTGGSMRPSIGFATSSTARATTTNVTTQVSPSYDKTYQRTSSAFAILNSSGSTLVAEFDLVSMDSDGFTVNLTTASTALYVFYAAVKGGRFSVGSFNQATSTGNQSVTGAGFSPLGGMFISNNRATSSSIQANSRLSIGAANSSSSRTAIWEGGRDNSSTGTLERDQVLNTGAVILAYTEGSGTETLNARADYVSNDSDGFTVNWDTADATAREIIYFVFGNTSGTATIVFDAVSTSKATGGVTSLTFAHTITNGLGNAGLFVEVAVNDSNQHGHQTTSVTYNGADLTKYIVADVSNDCRAEIWGLLGPTADGSPHNVVITTDGSVNTIQGGAISLGGVDQAIQPDASGSTGGATANPSLSVTTVTNGAWIIDCLETETAGSTVGGSQTSRWTQQSQSYQNGYCSTQGPIATAGATTMTWTSAANFFAYAAAAIKPATGGAVTTKKRLTLIGAGQ